MEKANLDWGTIGFKYHKVDYRYLAYYKDGKWGEGALDEGNQITLNESSMALHYGQACFEGLKAHTTKDNKVIIFRPDQNAQRINQTARRIMMPELPEGMFVDACVKVVKANLRWVPPYGSGASLYIRPFMFGFGENLILKPASEYLFSVFATPVGPYVYGQSKPITLTTTDYDRAAPMGTGNAKVAGNYAPAFLPSSLAVNAGFSDCIYLDSKTHTMIDEVGTSNFFGITKDGKFVTPKSPSILPSVTKYSIIHIAEKYLGMTAEERPIPVDELDQFAEAGACGTAAVITPIGKIAHNGTTYTFYNDGNEAGPVTKKLYQLLTGIQRGEENAPEGWLVEVR